MIIDVKFHPLLFIGHMGAPLFPIFLCLHFSHSRYSSFKSKHFFVSREYRCSKRVFFRCLEWFKFKIKREKKKKLLKHHTLMARSSMSNLCSASRSCNYQKKGKVWVEIFFGLEMFYLVANFLWLKQVPVRSKTWRNNSEINQKYLITIHF